MIVDFEVFLKVYFFLGRLFAFAFSFKISKFLFYVYWNALAMFYMYFLIQIYPLISTSLVLFDIWFLKRLGLLFMLNVGIIFLLFFRLGCFGMLKAVKKGVAITL